QPTRRSGYKANEAPETEARTLGLVGPRWDLHPCFWAGRCGRIVGSGAGTVVPVGLRRRGRSGRHLGVDRRLLNHDRWRCVHVIRRRVVPRVWIRRAPPERRTDSKEDSAVTPAELAPGGP